MIDNQLSTWTTSDELDYLDHIGTYAPSNREVDRLELLRQYQRALGFRPRSERYLDFKRIGKRVQELIDAG